jgi:lipopolysaccharide/colanic/teichoic acid biosynthesis glycosyltransferase
MDSLSASGYAVRIATPEVHEVLARTRLYGFAGVAYHAPPRTVLQQWEGSLKRLFDLVLSCALIVLSLPLALVIGLMIGLESRGGVIFRQMRTLSPLARPIRVYKFRSMVKNAEDGQDPGEHPEAGIIFKHRNDPRVTGVGRFIRKFSIDELPQLINVLKGEMSLVGPRPLPLADFQRLPPGDPASPLYERRRSAKPGITGLWQVSGRSKLTFQEMVVLDLYYAEHRTLLFDLEILLQTIPAVLTGRGAY